MLTWAVDNSKGLSGDLLELYCGNGNFTLPLAQNFGKVLATEVSKTSVESAQFNIAANKVDNIQIARMSSEEFSQAMDGVREFNRLRHVNLADYNFSTIFVDPPRAGLDPHTTSITQRFDNILYISCNPDTLRENLKTITQTHQIKAFAIFDQFPYTHHVECGVVLQKK
jgi:tRNA (uracil-5-)-methyltransferase